MRIYAIYLEGNEEEEQSEAYSADAAQNGQKRETEHVVLFGLDVIFSGVDVFLGVGVFGVWLDLR